MTALLLSILIITPINYPSGCVLLHTVVTAMCDSAYSERNQHVTHLLTADCEYAHITWCQNGIQSANKSAPKCLRTTVTRFMSLKLEKRLRSG